MISIETLDFPISDRGEYNSIEESLADIEFEPNKAIITAINKRTKTSVIFKVLLWGLFVVFILLVLFTDEVVLEHATLEAFLTFWFSYCRRVCCNSLKTSVNCRLSVSK